VPRLGNWPEDARKRKISKPCDNSKGARIKNQVVTSPCRNKKVPSKKRGGERASNLKLSIEAGKRKSDKVAGGENNQGGAVREGYTVKSEPEKVKRVSARSQGTNRTERKHLVDQKKPRGDTVIGLGRAGHN